MSRAIYLVPSTSAHTFLPLRLAILLLVLLQSIDQEQAPQIGELLPTTASTSWQCLDDDLMSRAIYRVLST
jgi:hypothetical protein